MQLRMSPSYFLIFCEVFIYSNSRFMLSKFGYCWLIAWEKSPPPPIPALYPPIPPLMSPPMYPVGPLLNPPGPPLYSPGCDWLVTFNGLKSVPKPSAFNSSWILLISSFAVSKMYLKNSSFSSVYPLGSYLAYVLKIFEIFWSSGPQFSFVKARM